MQSNSAMGGTNRFNKVEFYASRSNSVYGNSNTVQPPALAMRYIIKAFKGASASSTDIEITKVAQDVADKANRDLSNLSEKGRKAFFPSDTFVEIPITGNDQVYTAPANGFANAYGYVTQGDTYFNLANINSKVFLHINTTRTKGDTGAGRGIGGHVPVKKGDKVEFSYMGMDIKSFIFVYAEGEVPV